MGIHVDVAADGAAAVRMAALHPYDAILMDIQMPGMDGYEATRIIRADPAWAKRPIIAMTAHALCDDQTHCLAAGMNDHISKPIDKAHLYAVLSRWIADAERVVWESEAVVPTAQGEEGVPLPDALPGLVVADGLYRAGGNRRLYSTLLREFAREFCQTPAEVRRLLAGRRQGDLPMAGRQLHAIRGMAGNLAAQDLSQVAHTLEQAILAERRADWPELLQRFEQAMQQVVDSIQLLVGVDPPEEAEPVGAHPPDLAVITPLLTRLAALISSGSVDALTCMEELKPHLLGAGLGSALQRLDGSINQFDFDAAQIPLATIVQTLNICLES
ncbi:MAG: response regulator [Magnetococcus sp. YQC-3]